MAVTKKTVNLDVVQYNPTNNIKYKIIIYIPKDDSNIIIENPQSGKCLYVNEHSIQNYIKLQSTEFDWMSIPGIEDGKIKKRGDDTLSCLPVFNEDYIKADIVFCFTGSYDPGHQIKNIITNFTDNDFEYKFSVHKNNSVNVVRYDIKGCFYIPKLYAIFKSNRRTENVCIYKLFMKIGDTFYRFPYGNVNIDYSVCMGNNRNNFKNIDEFKIIFLSSIFNRDYGFQLNGLGFSNSTEICNHNPIFNLKYIEEKINDAGFNRNSLSQIEILYYLCKQKPENIDPKILVSCPNNPMGCI